MKKIIFILLCSIPQFLFAQKLTVMTFNTMCDVCKNGKNYSRFKDRLNQIADTIKRYDPDLISLQEFRTARQLKRLNKKLGHSYQMLYSKGFPFSYVDSTLFIKKERIKVLSHRSIWLGPRGGKFSFGWKFGIPRQLRWAYLRDLKTKGSFIFMGSHFDNHILNKQPSSEIVRDLIKSFTIPVIFAGDTNLTFDTVGIENLEEGMQNSYIQTKVREFSSNSSFSNKDTCNKRDIPFPKCLIDHILFSKNSPWQTSNWAMDLYKYGKKRSFASDHRAVVVELQYKMQNFH